MAARSSITLGRKNHSRCTTYSWATTLPWLRVAITSMASGQSMSNCQKLQRQFQNTSRNEQLQNRLQNTPNCQQFHTSNRQELQNRSPQSHTAATTTPLFVSVLRHSINTKLSVQRLCWRAA